MTQISLTKLTDFAALAKRWRVLEQAAPGGFFQSWRFLGCLAERRFTDPYLLAATDNGQDVALALLNRRARRLYLGETGDAALDAVFIEHNGILARHSGVLPICYRTLGTTTVSGIDDTQLAACRQAGLVHFHTQRFAPAVDLAALTTPFLDTVSANARSQIRRACKIYGATPHIQPAASLAEAHTYFDTMVGLHQASWQRRGQTGAFANTAMRDFHRTLIERAWPVQQADMLRIVCGARDIGYLYNFLYAGRVYCYQSGFIPAATPHEKPGLVCHSMAIAHYAAAGFGVYDMLGGASRYKTTLARQGQMLHWITLYPKTSLVGRARIVASKLAGREKLLSDARTGT